MTYYFEELERKGIMTSGRSHSDNTLIWRVRSYGKQMTCPKLARPLSEPGSFVEMASRFAVPALWWSKERRNFARLTRLLVDVGTQVLRNTFDSICPPGVLHAHLATPPVHATLQSLSKRILNPTQLIKLYPASPSSVSSEHFDIALLEVLLRTICCLTPPLTGWDNLPPAADTTVEADIARVKYYRNSVYGQASQASVDDTTFNDYWQDIRDPLVRLGGASYGTAIDNLKNEHIDQKLVPKQWKKDADRTNEAEASNLLSKPKDLLSEEALPKRARFLGDELSERDMLTFASTPGAESCSSTTSTSQTNLSQTSASLEVLEQDIPSSPSDKKLKVTLLADEWGSSKGGLSTINRELAMYLAKNPRVEVTCFLPHCSNQDKEEAGQHDISIVKAEEKAGFKPQVWLSFPPKDLAIDIVIGHGVKLGRQAPIIRDSHDCKCIQVVHTAPEELGMYKSDSSSISKAEEKHEIEVELCKRADLVVAIGPKLTEAVSCSLRPCGKDQDVFSLIPGTFIEFFDVKQASQDRRKFKVLIFGCGNPEDFSLKGFDIAALAVAKLEDKTYQLVFVGAPEGKLEELTNKLIQFIPKDQLIVRGYVQSRQKLKELFCEVDLAVMPSRTEGFGLTALEALSAGLPVLVSGNSGFGEALQEVQYGSPHVVKSEDASVWAEAIKSVRNKTRKLRLKEVTTLREYYAKKYSWEERCKRLVEKMWSLVDGAGNL